jgi:hypothetical protein
VFEEILFAVLARVSEAIEEDLVARYIIPSNHNRSSSSSKNISNNNNNSKPQTN